MRIIRPDDRDDDGHDHSHDEGRIPADPRAIGDILGDELEDYLAQVIADVPPPEDAQPTGPSRSGRPIGPKRPALHLVATDTDSDDDAEPEVDPDAAIEAGRAARHRMLRGAAGGSSVVVLSATLAAWGEPLAVSGPLAAYGAGWVAYLWWNAALRPSVLARFLIPVNR
ncbi:hypothetical protein [Nocardia sp. NPDC050710]|uniref:hypothetical protein n=1 Tax=Nocardia sp. NPDC050710 TaxID=3157220 RepID=UPI0033CFAA7D